MSDVAKNFDILVIGSQLIRVIIILTVQQNYFSDLYPGYPAKILNSYLLDLFPSCYSPDYNHVHVLKRITHMWSVKSGWCQKTE